MEFIETVVKQKKEEDEISIHLITGVDEYKRNEQVENFERIQSEVIKEGINFTWELDSTNTLHARSIVTNTGWEIILDRGLDIFQRFEANDAFSFTNRLQKYRQCKAFYINYIKK
jgi:ATP-dependent Lon protease